MATITAGTSIAQINNNALPGTTIVTVINGVQTWNLGNVAGSSSNNAQNNVGNNVVNGGVQITVDGNTNNDLLGSGFGDSIDFGGNTGDNTLKGGIGNDTVLGGRGDDIISGDQGIDRLFGGLGQDSLNGGISSDSLKGGANNDFLSGDNGNDFVNGNQGNDLIFGGRQDDSIHGGKGDDIISGGSGNDTISGDLGNDTLGGGGGNDEFVFNRDNLGQDVIKDFTPGEDIITIAADINDSGINAQNILARLSDDANGNTVVDLGDGNTITLVGVNVADLSVDDFNIV